MAHPNKDAVKSFGIVTGVGSLSEEVMRLAEAGEYTRFVISEWPGVFGSLHGFWAELFARSGRGVRLNPFHFDQIRQEIIARQIERAFLVGDFPPSRFFQVWMNERRRRHLKGIADERCIEGIATAPQELSKPAQYFYALQNLLTSLGVRPVRSCEVFPQLNLRVGNNTRRLLHLITLLNSINVRFGYHIVNSLNFIYLLVT